MASYHQNGCWSFRPFRLNFELEQSGDILQNLFSIHIVPIDFKDVIRVDVSYLTDIKFILKTVVCDVFVLLTDNVSVKNFFSSFKLFLAITVHAWLVHVDNHKRIRENVGFLHGKTLGSGFGKSRQDKALFLFLDGFNLFFN